MVGGSPVSSAGLSRQGGRSVCVEQRMVNDGITRTLCLLSCVPEAHEDSAMALCNLSFHSNSSRMVADGAGKALAGLLSWNKTDVRHCCIVAIRNLVCHLGNIPGIVASSDLIPAIGTLAREPETKVAPHAVAVLACISLHAEGRVALVEQGGIVSLMQFSEKAPPVIDAEVTRYVCQSSPRGRRREAWPLNQTVSSCV